MDRPLFLFPEQIKLMKFLFKIEKKIRGLPADMKPHSMLVTYAIPTSPGRCRILALFPRNFFAINKPRWLDHMERNDVLDGDLVFLHGQEREMRKPEYKYAENIDRVSQQVNQCIRKASRLDEGDSFISYISLSVLMINQPGFLHADSL